MAQYGRFDFTVLDSNGVPVNGATVELRHQGATVNENQSGSGSLAVTVDDVGQTTINGGLFVRVNTGTTDYDYTVTSDTTLTFSLGATTLTVNDDDRFTVSDPLPVIYNDARGDEPKTNPMTADSNGQVSCWVIGGPYDVLVSGTGITTRLYQDIFVSGGLERLSHKTSGSSDSLKIIKAVSTLSSTEKFLDCQASSGSSEFSINGAGGFTATGDCTISGATSDLLVGGDLGVTGNETIGGTLGVQGVSTLAGGATIGTSLTATGLVTAAAMATNAVADLKLSETNTTDDNVTGTTYTLIGTTSGNDFTVAVTPDSSASVIICVLTCRPYVVSGGASIQGGIRIRNTTANTTLAETSTVRQDAVNTALLGQSLCIVGVETGVTGANTYRGEMKGGDGSQVIHLNGDVTTARFIVFELKKSS